MKTQISLLVTSLAALPMSLFAQSPPPFLTANYSPVNQIATGAPPSPPETVAESTPCTPEPAITFKADSNETDSDLAERYARARRLIRKGAWRQAQLVLTNGIQKFPDSRHLRMVYADLLWHLSRRGEDQTILAQSSQQAVKAMEIGLDLRTVDQQLVGLLSDVLSRTQDTENFERLFARALALDSSSSTRRWYARGLSRMNSPLTEDAFKAAAALEDGGSAHADYGEWLLDHGRYEDVLTLIPQKPNLYYLLFLRGVALENLGRPGSARKAYKDFRAYSKVFPAPARFRIKGSNPQRGIRFDDQPADTTAAPLKALSNNDTIYGLAYMIMGEAEGENYGGKLAVGWVARARVHRGRLDTSPNPCPFIDKSQFAYLTDAYKVVICQGFDGACDAWCADPTNVCRYNQDTLDAGYDVYYGYKADPVTNHCPSGFIDQGDPCSKFPRRTCWGDLYSYKYASPLFQVAVAPTTGCGIQQSCAPDVYGKICADGGYRDHCFSGNRSCVGPGRVFSSGTLSTQGSALVTASYPINSTTPFVHRAHLEAPEGSNFDLYLEYSPNGINWVPKFSSTQRGAVEDVEPSTTDPGYFRWRIVAYQGTGTFRLCAKQQ